MYYYKLAGPWYIPGPFFDHQSIRPQRCIPATHMIMLIMVCG